MERSAVSSRVLTHALKALRRGPISGTAKAVRFVESDFFRSLLAPTPSAQFSFLSQILRTDTLVGVPSTSNPIRPDLLFEDLGSSSM